MTPIILLQNIAKFDTFLKHYFLYKKNYKKFYKSQKFFQTQQSYPKPSRVPQTQQSSPNPAEFSIHYFFSNPADFLRTQQRFSHNTRFILNPAEFSKPSRTFSNPAELFQTQQKILKPSRIFPNPAENFSNPAEFIYLKFWYIFVKLSIFR